MNLIPPSSKWQLAEVVLRTLQKFVEHSKVYLNLGDQKINVAGLKVTYVGRNTVFWFFKIALTETLTESINYVNMNMGKGVSVRVY